MWLFREGDRVRLRKAHPCGGDVWEVTRTGVDVGLKCLTCGRKVMIPRLRLERRVVEILDRGQGDVAGPPAR